MATTAPTASSSSSLGWDDLYNRAFLQWIRIHPDKQETIVDRTVPIKEIAGKMAHFIAQVCAAREADDHRYFRRAPRSTRANHFHHCSHSGFYLYHHDFEK